MKENAFEQYHLKKTHARERLLSLLEKSSHPLTADEIYLSFRKKDVNLSTIYRSLKAFEEKGLIKKEVNEKKENVYSLNQKEDNHILVCTKCHKRIPLQGCPFHEVNEKIEEETGFLLQDQNIELYGICKDCQKKEKV